MATSRTVRMTRTAVLRLSGGRTDSVMTGVEMFTDDRAAGKRRTDELNDECRRTGNSDRFIEVDLTVVFDDDKFPD